MQWKRIDTPHMYGVVAEVGERKAEVVRAYAGQWLAFLKIDNHMCKRMPGEHEYMGYAEAKTLAAQFLRGEFTPEVWNAVSQL